MTEESGHWASTAVQHSLLDTHHSLLFFDKDAPQ